jgi:hypothetical protein
VGKVIDFKPLAPHHCGFSNQDRDFGFFHVSEDTYGLPPSVKLESLYKTYTSVGATLNPTKKK